MSDADKIFQDIITRRTEILERFGEAYIAETGLKPSEIEMCQLRNVNGLTVWFRRKDSEGHADKLIVELEAERDAALAKSRELETKLQNPGGLVLET